MRCPIFGWTALGQAGFRGERASIPRAALERGNGAIPAKKQQFPMQDSLLRLKRLQRQLETLHRSTAEVLAASHDLLRKMESGETPSPATKRKAVAKKRKGARR
jgi:hypothetical protein